MISISTESHDQNPGTGIPVTPWKRVWCCVGRAIQNLYLYLSVPVTGVEEGVDVLKVPIIGHPVTTEEVSVKQRINRNAQK